MAKKEYQHKYITLIDDSEIVQVLDHIKAMNGKCLMYTVQYHRAGQDSKENVRPKWWRRMQCRWCEQL